MRCQLSGWRERDNPGLTASRNRMDGDAVHSPRIAGGLKPEMWPSGMGGVGFVL